MITVEFAVRLLIGVVLVMYGLTGFVQVNKAYTDILKFIALIAGVLCIVLAFH